MKKFLKILFVVVSLAFFSYVIDHVMDEKYAEMEQENVAVVDKEQEVIPMCYMYNELTDRGLYDRAWVRLNIQGESVTGEFRNLPAEKDSKVGEFSGTVSVFDPAISGRVASVVWNSMAEGMQVTEELKIIFGEGSAVAFFGEMEDRGDGVYVYKDKENLFPSQTMSQIDCDSLKEMLSFESAIRENIGFVATNDEVLGGTWYVVSVSVNTFSDEAIVVYEDGHIQSKAKILYSYNKDTDEVEISSFTVL